MNTRRKGKICISDAKIRVNDDTGDFKNGFDAEPILKAKIVLRLVAYLKSQGWAFHVPYDDYAWLEENSSSHGVKKKGRPKFAEKHRKGIKDGLEVEICASGVGVDIEFWENVVDHTADNSHGGRHIFDKESKMPYRQLCRLRATKLKIINFLTKYHDYTLMDNAHPLFPKRQTGIDLVQKSYDESWHRDGSDIWNQSLQGICEYNARSADGNQIEHGSMVWTRDYKERWVYGRAMYNINNMWWILSGKWDRYNKANFEIYTSKPADLNVRVSREKATRSLESKIKSAVDKKDFLLAHRLQTAFNQQFGESEAA
ncbi:hypothetical protein ACEWA7_20375 [Vibrio parahaemolyticus]